MTDRKGGYPRELFPKLANSIPKNESGVTKVIVQNYCILLAAAANRHHRGKERKVIFFDKRSNL